MIVESPTKQSPSFFNVTYIQARAMAPIGTSYLGERVSNTKRWGSIQHNTILTECYLEYRQIGRRIVVSGSTGALILAKCSSERLEKFPPTKKDALDSLSVHYSL